MLKILKIQIMTFEKLTQEIKKKKIPKLTFCLKTLEKKNTFTRTKNVRGNVT